MDFLFFIIGPPALDHLDRHHFYHLGPLRLADRTIEPTGKPFRVRMAASFEFAPGSAKIICERPYFDQGAVLRAIGIA